MKKSFDFEINLNNLRYLMANQFIKYIYQGYRTIYPPLTICEMLKKGANSTFEIREMRVICRKYYLHRRVEHDIEKISIICSNIQFGLSCKAN